MALAESARQTRQWWLGIALAYPGLFALLLILEIGGDVVSVSLNGISEVIAAAVAALTCFLTSRRHAGAARRGWAYLALGCGLWSVGQGIWTYYAVLRGVPTPFPSVADILFLSFVPLAGLALFELTGSSVRLAGRFRIALDSLIVGLGLFAVGWMMLLRPIVAQSDATVLEKWVGLAYPVTDITLAALVISLLPRAHPGDRRSWYLLGGGLACLALADTVFVFLELQGIYQQAITATDAGWIAGFLLVAVAPLYYEGKDNFAPLHQHKFGTLLPHLTLIPVFLIGAVFVLSGHALDVPSSVLLVFLVILGAISQFTTNRENLDLVDDLEDAVARARESEESARQVAVRLEEAQRVAKVGIWEWDPKTDFVWATDQTAAILDAPDLHFPVRLAQLLERVDPEDRAPLVAHLARATNGQGAFRMDVRVGARSANQRSVHIRGDAGSEARNSVTGTIHDVTDRKRAEERLVESRKLLEEAQSLARVGNWEYDVAADKFDLSPEMYRIMGADPETFQPSLDDFLSFVPADERSVLLTSLRQLYGSRGPQDIEHRIIRADGGIRWVHERAQARPALNGRIAKLFGTVHDITDRKLVEEERALSVLREKELLQLKEMNDFKTQFINMAAHELRTPITPIRVLVHMLRARAETDKRKKDVESLGVVDRNVIRLERLVEDLLSAARIQSQRMKVDRGPLNLATIIADSTRTFTAVANERGIHLGSTVEGNVSVHGDGGRISQVLYNLLDNALKFTPAGGHVNVRATSDEGNVTVRVEDTGSGMRPDQLARLFQPFSQVHDPELAPQVGGTGLGLYISRGIIEAHGGTMWCESEGPGKGSSFVFSLPRSAAAQVLAVAAEVPHVDD